MLLIAFLDLPIGSIVSIDGRTVSILRDDFIGFEISEDDCDNISSSTDDDEDDDVDERHDDDDNYDVEKFHFVTVRCNNNDISSKKDTRVAAATAAAASITTGFFIPRRNDNSKSRRSSSLSSGNKCDDYFIMKYDPRTEEVSTMDTIDEQTITNLLSFCNNSEARRQNPYRIIPYNQFIIERQQQQQQRQVATTTSRSNNDPTDSNNTTSSSLWDELTCYITAELLQRRGRIHPGDKIVPTD
jgi:hypothetical protein